MRTNPFLDDNSHSHDPFCCSQSFLPHNNPSLATTESFQQTLQPIKVIPFFHSFLHSAYVTVIQFYLSPSLSLPSYLPRKPLLPEHLQVHIAVLQSSVHRPRHQRLHRRKHASLQQRPFPSPLIPSPTPSHAIRRDHHVRIPLMPQIQSREAHRPVRQPPSAPQNQQRPLPPPQQRRPLQTHPPRGDTSSNGTVSSSWQRTHTRFST